LSTQDWGFVKPGLSGYERTFKYYGCKDWQTRMGATDSGS